MFGLAGVLLLVGPEEFKVSSARDQRQPRGRERGVGGGSVCAHDVTR